MWAGPLSLGAVFAVIAAGVAIAACGHLFGRRTAVVVGIVVLMAATLLLFGSAFSSWDKAGRPPSSVGAGR